jgi:hypothetical protein
MSSGNIDSGTIKIIWSWRIDGYTFTSLQYRNSQRRLFMALISNATTIFDNGSMASGFGGSMTFIKKLTA